MQMPLLLKAKVGSIVLVRHLNKEHRCINKSANMHVILR